MFKDMSERDSQFSKFSKNKLAKFKKKNASLNSYYAMEAPDHDSIWISDTKKKHMLRHIPYDCLSGKLYPFFNR